MTQIAGELRVALTEEGLPRLEPVLTQACARILELETDVLRLERRIRELSERATENGVGEEMTALARERSATARELALLRPLVSEAMTSFGPQLRPGRL